jgi:hypothetical protein
MPRIILAHVDDSAAQSGAAAIIAKLWRTIRIEIPIGYEDETGFHIGVKCAEQTNQKTTGLVMDDWFNRE